MAPRKFNSGTKVKVEQMVTDRILAAIDSGTLSKWNAPWISAGRPDQNLISKRPYNGVNVLLTWIARVSKNYTSPYWLTYKQCASLGGQVRTGEKATIIVYFKKLKVQDKQTGDDKFIPLLRYFSVFNTDQCDGLEDKIPADPKVADGFDPLDSCEEIIDGWKDSAPINYGGDSAFYNIKTDEVTLPKREQFKSAEGFYSTAFHELTHKTGHESRLNREFGKQFGNDPYAKEELVAELGAAFLCAHAGINNEDDSAGYIKHWRDKIAADPKLILWAASKAQKATDLILGIEKNYDNDSETSDSETSDVVAVA